MIRRWQAVACAVTGAWVLAGPGSAATSTWIGAGADNNWTTGANWLSGVAPSAGDDVDVTSMVRYYLLFGTSPAINSLTLGGQYHELDRSTAATLNLGAGGLITTGDTTQIDAGLTLNLTAAQTWSIAGSTTGFNRNGEVRVAGVLTGTGFTKTGAGKLTLNGADTLTGTVTLNQGSLKLGNDSALGTATLAISDLGLGSTVESGGGNRTLANAVQINSSFQLYTDKGGLTFTGPVTLQASPTITVNGANPVTLSGAISESGGSQAITLNGSGTLVVQGTMTTTGGATVAGGNLIFGPTAVMPVTGTFTAGSNGYIGTNLVTGVQAGFLNRLSPTLSTGAAGFEGGSVIPDAIDLTGFAATFRLGSASTATLQGAITPQGLTYNFGGGGGLLTVSGNLPDGVTAARSLSLNSVTGQSLTLDLAGTNAYAGGTTIQNSALRFGSAAAIPSSGTYTIVNQGYLGFDYLPTLASFSGRVAPTSNTNLVIGYDSAAPQTVASAIDLTSFPNSSVTNTYTYLGTTTNLTVTGALTPAGGVSQPWRFAGVKSGHLTVASNLSGSTGVVINLPNDYSGDYDLSAGQFTGTTSTVTLTGTNTYSGGTTLQGGRLELGNASALGTGTLTAASSILAVTTSGLTIANPIVNASGGDSDGLHLEATDAAHSYTLSGGITGRGTLYQEGAGAVTLSGGVNLPNRVSGSSTYYSDVIVRGGTLNLGNTFTAGGELDLYDGTAVNLAAGVAATVGELSTDKSPGGTGVINLGAGSVLTLNEVGENSTPYFSGPINGGGSLVISGSGTQYLGMLPGPSTSTYSGGTTITGGALYALSNGALGTGPITVNVAVPSQGGLGVYTGVTLTNPLTFTRGTLAGYGTFAPSNGPVTVGTANIIRPGNLFPTDPVGTLTFATGLTLASGGTYIWEIQNAAGTIGVNSDLLAVNGTLTITATPTGPFNLQISSLTTGLTGFNNTLTYSWLIATSTGGVSGFNANAFALTAPGIATGSGSFYLSLSGNNLLLNFTPVPEPSTAALTAAGLLVLAAAGRRRRGQGPLLWRRK